MEGKRVRILGAGSLDLVLRNLINIKNEEVMRSQSRNLRHAFPQRQTPPRRRSRRHKGMKSLVFGLRGRAGAAAVA
ncbi:hypothetical protein FHS53_003538 [Xanthobacter tagetidis]|jgi:hypothetical protein|nr:hypothetical protein [Xanthobacter tagetidis]